MVEVEHFQNRIVCAAVFFTKVFVVIEHLLLDGEVVFKDDISAYPYPCFLGGCSRQFDGRMVYQFLVNVLAIAGAEPESVVGLETEFEGAYSGFAVHTDGGEELDGIFL